MKPEERRIRHGALIDARAVHARSLGLYDLADHYANRAEQARAGRPMHAVHGIALEVQEQSPIASNDWALNDPRART